MIKKYYIKDYDQPSAESLRGLNENKKFKAIYGQEMFNLFNEYRKKYQGLLEQDNKDYSNMNFWLKPDMFGEYNI